MILVPGSLRVPVFTVGKRLHVGWARAVTYADLSAYVKRGIVIMRIVAITSVTLNAHAERYGAAADSGSLYAKAAERGFMQRRLRTARILRSKYGLPEDRDDLLPTAL